MAGRSSVLMDCSVTMRWTKPSNRFLKPALDESKVSSACCWYLKWGTGQHGVASDAPLWGLELDSRHRNWGGLFRSFPAYPPSLCGQPHGGRFPWCSAVGSDQYNRRPFAFRSDAGVERRTDAPAFSCFGRLGGVWRFSVNHQSGLTGRRRTFLRRRAGPQSFGSFSAETYCYLGRRICWYAHRGMSRRKIARG